MGMVLTEFYLFKLPLLPVLGESCFKAPKVTLDEYFYHWNVYFCYFCTLNQLWAITVWEDRCDVGWISFISVGFIGGIWGKLF